MYLPGNRVIRRSKASKSDLLQGLQYEFDQLRSQMGQAAESAMKLENKTGILTAGLQVCLSSPFFCFPVWTRDAPAPKQT